MIASGYMPAAWMTVSYPGQSGQIWTGCGIGGVQPIQGVLDELRMDSTTYTLAELQALAQAAEPFVDVHAQQDPNVLKIKDGITAPTQNITGYAQMYVDSTDGDLKIRFADGTVKTIMTDT